MMLQDVFLQINSIRNEYSHVNELLDQERVKLKNTKSSIKSKEAATQSQHLKIMELERTMSSLKLVKSDKLVILDHLKQSNLEFKQKLKSLAKSIREKSDLISTLLSEFELECRDFELSLSLDPLEENKSLQEIAKKMKLEVLGYSKELNSRQKSRHLYHTKEGEIENMEAIRKEKLDGLSKLIELIREKRECLGHLIESERSIELMASSTESLRSDNITMGSLLQSLKIEKKNLECQRNELKKRKTWLDEILTNHIKM